MRKEKSPEYKQMAKELNSVGEMVLLYTALIVFCATVVMILIGIGKTLGGMSQQKLVEDMANNIMEYDTGAGEILAVLLGGLLLLLWKKKSFIKERILNKNNNMSKVDFVKILPIFFMGQLIAIMFYGAFEFILNKFGLSIKDNVDAVSSVTGSTGIVMLIYSCFIGPIAEEFWFRGAVLRTIEPYGKNLAIFASAFMFGLFHENFTQGIFAFYIGLVLAYVALEYSIKYSIIIHIINNLVLARGFSFALSGVSDEKGFIIEITIEVFLFILGLIVLIMNRNKVKSYLCENKINRENLKCYFTRPWNIVYIVVILLLCISGIEKL